MYTDTVQWKSNIENALKFALMTFTVFVSVL
jgi:hypothetical protein